MKINSINKYNNEIFKQNSNSKNTSITDKFVSELEKENKKQYEGTFLQKNLGCNSSMIPFYITFVYGLVSHIRQKQLAKILSKSELQKKVKVFNKILLIMFSASFPISFIINQILNKKTEHNQKQLNKKFKEINTDTDAKLADKMIYSNYKGASYNPISGIIHINKNIVNDPISNINIEKIIKHELIHAKQFETVGRSKDGIKKINFYIINQAAKFAKNKPIITKEFQTMYNEIQNEKTDKYKNIKIKIGGADIDLIKYITGVNVLINNENATYNDIPIVIDENYYNKVINKKGHLTLEEEKKADEYYKAMLEYVSANKNNVFNPFSKYRNNLLEKEAYKENTSIFNKLI